MPLYRPRRWREDAVLELWESGWAMRDVARLSGMALADVAKIIGGRVRGGKRLDRHDDDPLNTVRKAAPALAAFKAALLARLRRGTNNGLS
jgi:hypothetical protein